jgi:hypothetical protein
MSKLHLLLLLLAVLSVTACKRDLVSTKTIAPSDFSVEQFDFDYFVSKAKIRFQEGAKMVNGTANIRMRKDSLIWFSISPNVGVEVTRALISPDTVLIINRVDKEYYVFNYREISRYFDFPVDFNLIQAILLGNLPQPVDASTRIARDEGRYLLKQQEGDLDFQTSVNTQNLKVENVVITEQPSEKFMNIQYMDFKAVQNLWFPHDLQMSLTYKDDKGTRVTSLNLAFNKAEISDKPLKFPFTLPEKYEAFK